MKAIRRNELRRHLALDIGDFRQRRIADFPTVRFISEPANGRHDCIFSLQSQVDRSDAEGMRLFEIGARRQMPGQRCR